MKKIGLTLVAFLILFTIAFLLFNSDADAPIEEENAEAPVNNVPQADGNDQMVDFDLEAEADGFLARAKYEGDNQWSYIVTGFIPTPCHSIEYQVIVAESFPEQVTIFADISSPSEDTVCIQVLEEVVHEGTYSASEKASLSLSVNRN